MSTSPMTPNTPMTELLVELEPCPFCGGSVVMTELDDEDERRFWVRYVVCDNCDTRMRGWTGWPPKGVPFDRQVMSDEVEVSLSAAWNRRHLSATVSAGDGEAFGTAWQTSYTGDEWHFAREASFSPSDLERGIVKNVTPLFAASRLSQGTGDSERVKALEHEISVHRGAIRRLLDEKGDLGSTMFAKGVLDREIPTLAPNPTGGEQDGIPALEIMGVGLMAHMVALPRQKGPRSHHAARHDHRPGRDGCNQGPQAMTQDKAPEWAADAGQALWQECLADGTPDAATMIALALSQAYERGQVDMLAEMDRRADKMNHEAAGAVIRHVARAAIRSLPIEQEGG